MSPLKQSPEGMDREINSIEDAKRLLEQLDQDVDELYKLSDAERKELKATFDELEKKIVEWDKQRVQKKLSKEKTIDLNLLKRKFLNLKEDAYGGNALEDEYARPELSETDKTKAHRELVKLGIEFPNLLWKIDDDHILLGRKDYVYNEERIVKAGGRLWKIEGTKQTMKFSQAIRLANLINYIEGMTVGKKWEDFFVERGKLYLKGPIKHIMILSKIPDEFPLMTMKEFLKLLKSETRVAGHDSETRSAVEKFKKISPEPPKQPKPKRAPVPPSERPIYINGRRSLKKEFIRDLKSGMNPKLARQRYRREIDEKRARQYQGAQNRASVSFDKTAAEREWLKKFDNYTDSFEDYSTSRR